MQDRVGRPASSINESSWVNAPVARIVPAGALELATRVGQLPAVRASPGRVRVSASVGSFEDALELGGGLGRAPRLSA